MRANVRGRGVRCKVGEVSTRWREANFLIDGGTRDGRVVGFNSEALLASSHVVATLPGRWLKAYRVRLGG